MRDEPRHPLRLSFQKLDVYRCAIEFFAFVVKVSEAAPRGNAALLDQLRRAGSSVALNIAEAARRTGSADAARTYAIARGSAMECAAVLDTLLLLGAIEAKEKAPGDELLERLVAMLTKLCRLSAGWAGRRRSSSDGTWTLTWTLTLT